MKPDFIGFDTRISRAYARAHWSLGSMRILIEARLLSVDFSMKPDLIGFDTRISRAYARAHWSLGLMRIPIEARLLSVDFSMKPDFIGFVSYASITSHMILASRAHTRARIGVWVQWAAPDESQTSNENALKTRIISAVKSGFVSGFSLERLQVSSCSGRAKRTAGCAGRNQRFVNHEFEFIEKSNSSSKIELD